MGFSTGIGAWRWAVRWQKKLDATSKEITNSDTGHLFYVGSGVRRILNRKIFSESNWEVVFFPEFIEIWKRQTWKVITDMDFLNLFTFRLLPCSLFQINMMFGISLFLYRHIIHFCVVFFFTCNDIGIASGWSN